MKLELIGVIIGGIIGITAGILPTLVFHCLDKRRRRKAIVRTIKAEVISVKEKAERFLEGESSPEELKASIPLWSKNLALELAFVSTDVAVDTRRVVTLDMEMRMTGREEKAAECIEPCEKALKSLKYS